MISTRYVFHININCTDLEKSLAFYKLLGFREVIDFDAPDAAEPDGYAQGVGVHGPAFRLPANAKARGRLLAIGDHPWCARIDLLQWLEPKTAGKSYPDLSHVGLARVCFRVDDAWASHKILKEAGADVFSEPQLIKTGGFRQLFFCAHDPDGVVVEFMEFLNE